MDVSNFPPFMPPWPLHSGLMMTLHVALVSPKRWQRSVLLPEPDYQSHWFQGAEGVPIYGIWAAPPQAQGTVIGTYGITGDLDNQWFLRILGRKAFARQLAVVLFDWRAHGKTGAASATLTSDGLNEGPDFLHIAAEAKRLGCPPPFWLVGYSLGGQLALWGAKATCACPPGLAEEEVGGATVVCPSLDSQRSLRYLEAHPVGRYLEGAIATTLQSLAWELHRHHPDAIDPEAIKRAHSIRTFDRELVIGRLGFDTVADYYAASSPLPWLPHLATPTLMLYAADDPLFAPELVPEVAAACAQNPKIDLLLTDHGGHVGYISGPKGQAAASDPDPWWAWNRCLDWIECLS